MRVSWEEHLPLALMAFHLKPFEEKPCLFKKSSVGHFSLPQLKCQTLHFPLLSSIFGEQSMSNFYLQATFDPVGQHCFIVSQSVSYGRKHVFMEWGSLGFEKGQFHLSPKIGNNREWLLRSLLSHLASHSFVLETKSDLGLLLLAVVLKPGAPRHLRTMFPTSFHYLKRWKPKITRGSLSLFHFFSAPHSHLIVTFTWMTVLSLLRQPKFLYLTSSYLATLLRHFKHLCSILPIAPTLPHSLAPSVVYSLFTTTHISNQD